jgi:NTP pyrophosphatase (non-canonical NTP hydrolase)
MNLEPSEIVSKEFCLGYDSIASEVHQMARDKGLWDQERNQGEMIALMHSELSEGLEALRKNLVSDHIPDFTGIEEELADVIIRIMDFGHAFNLQIAQAVIAKIKFNATRPHRHGGKKF